MKWNCLTIKTTADAEDMIICTLAELGLEGAEIIDRQPLPQEDLDQMFVDIVPDGIPVRPPMAAAASEEPVPDMPWEDGTAYLNFYLEEDADREEILIRVRQELEALRSFMDIGEGTIRVSQTEDKDWINNWKEFFHQFYADDILIVPSWEEVKAEDQDRMILHMDPGTAFGTGMHETTQLVIRQLKKYVKKGDCLLDVGTGSGILGIVALKLGAAHVMGTDLDPCAASAVAENKASNGILEEAFEMRIGNVINDPAVQAQVGYEKYDIVAANILADVLLALAPAILPAMKKGGYYITSGILDVKEDQVVQAVKEAGLTLVEVTRQGEWVCVTARKD
ncbi:MAG: 50S ribosomal protein L11 methyltransferase [Clostridiales bacterium]|nr:50S ribosomal protein L11 methyltransferase [Clostridiales bacterium]